MTDIDFDELDKAVNNLMGNVGKERTDGGPKEKVFTVSSTLKPGEKPEYEKLGEVAKTIGNETLVGQGELTVVEKLNPEEPQTPLPEAKTKPAESEIPAVSTPISNATQSLPKPIVPAVKRPASGRFMDVVHPSSDMKIPSAPSRVESPSITTPSEPEKPAEVTVSTDSIPLTPFLPDAKVEKRPLGEPVAADELSTKSEPTAESNSVNEQISEQPEKKKEYDDQQLIDATSVVGTLSADEKELQAVESGEILADKGPSISAVESGDTESLKKEDDKTPSHVSTDETAGDIYDIKGDHQPLGHPAKQKSGWGTVIIIVLVILLFAALAGAAYFIFGFGI